MLHSNRLLHSERQPMALHCKTSHCFLFICGDNKESLKVLTNQVKSDALQNKNLKMQFFYSAKKSFLSANEYAYNIHQMNKVWGSFFCEVGEA